MKRLHWIFGTAALALCLAGCDGDRKAARERLDKARTLYETGDFLGARSEIDSVRTLYPKEVDALREALTLSREVEMGEARRNIAYCDSLLPIKRKEAEELTKGFTFEKDSLYEEVGHYVWRGQTIERNLQRCYVRSRVSERGEMSLASVYYGGRAIDHTGIRLSLDDGQFSQTPNIPYDGGLNYRFKDMGATTEVVTYEGANGQQTIKFIYDNRDRRIRVEYTGGRPYVIYMADADKRAIAATYDLATVLSDVESMRRLKEKSEKQIVYLEAKLAEGMR